MLSAEISWVLLVTCSVEHWDGGYANVIFITKSVPQPFEHKELCKSTLSLESTSSRKDCPRHCQSLAGMEDVDSEKQKRAQAVERIALDTANLLQAWRM